MFLVCEKYEIIEVNNLPDQLASTLVHCLQLSGQAKDFIVTLMLEKQARRLEQFELS